MKYILAFLFLGVTLFSEIQIASFYRPPALQESEKVKESQDQSSWEMNFEPTNKLQNDWSLWQFLARINIDYEANSGYKPAWWLETIQPLYISPQSYRNTFFLQGTGLLLSNKAVYNIGGGYRVLTPDLNWLIGVNGFYDFASRNGVQNWSVGAEILTGWPVFTMNYYGRSGQTSPETSIRGYDVELIVPTPHMPWLRIGASYSHWDSLHFKDINAYTIHAMFHIWGPLEIEGGTIHSNIASSNFIRIRFNFGVPNRIHYTFYKDGFTRKMFPKRTLKKLVLNPVLRFNDIPTEVN